MYLSIVIPCYNEEANIDSFYKETTKILETNNVEFQLIFINDGSKDLTIEKIKELSNKDPRILFISLSRNFGKEAAMLAGLKYADGDVIIIMDADLQHPPSLIPEMLEAYYLSGVDQVIARRNRKGESIHRSIASRLFYKIMNNFVDIDLKDGIGDFRLLSRKAVTALLSLSEYNRFSKGLFSWIGFKEKIINYENITRNEGESKWSFSKLLNYGIDGIISFNNKPLRFSIYLGLLITLIGVLYVISTLFNIILHGITEPGYFTLISFILLFGGVQLICLGIMGEYIGRIYYETKRRPHFLIEESNLKLTKEEKVNEYYYI